MSKMRLQYPVACLCRMLKVSASGFYAWTIRPPSGRAKEEMRLEVAIKAAHPRTRQTYGAQRLQREMAEDGIKVGISRTKRIKRKLGLYCKQKRKFKVTTDSKHKLPVAENLLKQQFKVYEPNAVWVSDITYVPTDEGWLYLAQAQGPLYQRDCRLRHGRKADTEPCQPVSAPGGNHEEAGQGATAPL